MTGYANWMAYCTTCQEQGPVARDENDEDAQIWCDDHNGNNAGHQAMIIAGSDI